MKKYFVLGLWLLNMVACAQKNDCNRNVWIKSDEKLIPKQVCIPSGYLIYNIYEQTDFNGDGLKDFFFKWGNAELKDGDTLFVSIYNQNPDSTFTHFKTFNNLYPIYFKEYGLNYKPVNKELDDLHKKYEGEYQFLELEFKKGLISLLIKYEAKVELEINYQYDLIKRNWIYQDAELHDFALNKTSKIDLSKKVGPTINDFTYFYWEKDE